MASIAKITRPRVSGTVKRDRLFQLLDQGTQKPVIWVAAQAGSGKTTLVADWLDARKLPCLWYQIDEGDGDIAGFFYYMGLAAKSAAPRYRQPLPLLTPEYLQGVPVFTRRYFEAIFRRLKAPSVVVLDNYQDAPIESGFHDMIARGLDTVPEGITVVILSRAAPPPKLARLQANNLLCTIGWDAVRFSHEESSELLEAQGYGTPSPETLDILQAKTEGWAAGLILLTAGLDAAASSPFADMATDKVFDYFAAEIFNKTDSSVQEILLKTSFLQKIDPGMAENLTGNTMAEKVLERMSRNRYFTQKYGQAYQYHPLFREYLQTRAQADFSSADIVAVQQKAAELLEQSGYTEEAVRLYIAAADWNSAERLALSLARTLVSQGRGNTLEAWLNSFPPEHLNNSSWSLHWVGICRMAYSPADARGYLEKAFLRFQKVADVPGLFLTWACIVDTFIYEWGDFKPLDHWIGVAEKLLADHPAFPSPEIEARVVVGMLSSVMYRQPYREELPVWAERVRQVVLKHSSTQMQMMLGNYLITYYLWVGDFAKAGLIIETLRPVSCRPENDALTRQHWYVMEATYSFFIADNQTCMKVIAEGLNNAEESGVHLLDLYLLGQGVYSGLSLGEPSAARLLLEKMASINSPRLLDKSFYHYQASAVAWHDGDLKRSIEHGKLAVRLSQDISTPFAAALCLVELASILFDDGQHEEALRNLAQAKVSGRGMNLIAYMCSLQGARFAFHRGDEREGMDLLKQGLALGARQGYYNTPRWNNRTMSRLCAKALEFNVEPDYVKNLIRRRSLTPDGDVVIWPYRVTIYTLGKFEILRDDKPVTFTGKVQKRPIELLKVLIALGGKQVPDVKLIDALWPDSEGDAGHGALKSTILRLRQLIGADEAVLVRGGTVTLDPRLCSVDAFAFDQLVQEPESQNRPQAVENAESAIALKVFEFYRGQFLPADSAIVWTSPLRERLRGKFLRFILKRGKTLEQQGSQGAAIELYHRALEADELQEEFYQGLMSCYLELGQQAEAISTYQRCKNTLTKATGAPLSNLTEALKRAALERKA